MRSLAAFLLGVSVTGVLWGVTSWLSAGDAPPPGWSHEPASLETDTASKPASQPSVVSSIHTERKERLRTRTAASPPADGEERHRRIEEAPPAARAKTRRDPPTEEAVLGRLSPAVRAQLDQAGDYAPGFALHVATIGVWVDDATLQRLALRYLEIQLASNQWFLDWMSRGRDIHDEGARKAWEKEREEGERRRVLDLYASFQPYFPRADLDRAFREIYGGTPGPWSESGR